jgi:hypothetical protein
MKNTYKKIKLSEIIKESRQVGSVYHFTGIYQSISILEDDLLMSSPSHTSLDTLSRITKKNYKSVISTTRDKNFENSRVQHYGKIENSNALAGGVDVVFCFDGNKLSEKYLTMPYDDFYKAKQKGVLSYNPEDDEMEQLWYGKKIDKDGGIRNLSKYLKYVEIQDELSNKLKYAGKSYVLQFIDLIEKLINLCNEKNIELRFEDKNFDFEKFKNLVTNALS